VELAKVREQRMGAVTRSRRYQNPRRRHPSPPVRMRRKLQATALKESRTEGKRKGKCKAPTATTMHATAGLSRRQTAPAPLSPEPLSTGRAPPKQARFGELKGKELQGTESARTPPTRTLVSHGAPTWYKPGTMRRWIEEDSKNDKI